MKVNNLILVHWLNILCKRGDVSNGVIAVSATLTYHAVAYLHFYLPKLIDSEN